METTLKTDVVIVGAGPTGLSLAAQLIRYGIDFVIFDKKETVTDLSKALIVHARTLEIYDQIGLAHRAVEEGEIVQQLAFLHEGRISAQVDFSDIGGKLSPFPFLLVFEQSKNEHLLYEHLKQSGKDVQWQTELESLTQDADAVKAVLKTATGDTQTVEARYLVGCDGASSATRHQLGLGFEGSTQPRLFYVADVEMEFESQQGTLYLAPGRDAFALLAPMQGEKHWRLIGNLPEYDAAIAPEVTYGQVEAKVQSLVQRNLDIQKVRWFSSYKVHTRHAEAFSVGRCFLAGDAAHVHTPVGGQGMNTGIQDAYNLAWKLAFALNGHASDALLASYGEERLANAKRLLQTTDQAFELAASDQWYFRFFRDNIFPTLANVATRFGAAKEFLFPLISQIGISYGESALSQHKGDHEFAVKAGDRMPYFLVDGASVYDGLRNPKFHLLAFSNGEQSYEELKSKVEAEFGTFVDFRVVPLYPHVAEIFGSDKPFLVLLRPDNYLGLISGGLDFDEVGAYLGEVLSLS